MNSSVICFINEQLGSKSKDNSRIASIYFNIAEIVIHCYKVIIDTGK